MLIIVVCNVCCVMFVVCRAFCWLPLFVVCLSMLFVVNVYVALLVGRWSSLFVGCRLLYGVVRGCLLFVVLWICCLQFVVDVCRCSCLFVPRCSLLVVVVLCVLLCGVGSCSVLFIFS